MEFTLFNVLATGVIALVAGIAVGVVLVQQMTPTGRKQRDMEQNLDRLMRQQRGYQQEVVSHFNQTAHLLANLTENYREIHKHLATGASTFNAEEGSEILQRLMAEPAAHLEASGPVTEVRQPLDYAPRRSPHEPGMLNESFGLEKVAEEPPALSNARS
jgi:uncharacterized membrane-anchored protein YhcB (DUF1043 family)